MSGWDPAQDLSVALDTLAQPGDRRVIGPPPARPTITEPAAAPEAPTVVDPDRLPVPAPKPAPAPSPAGGEVSPKRRGRPPHAQGPRRSTTAYVPEGLVRELKLRRLAAAADGQRLHVNDWVNAAVTDLPTSAAALDRALADHADDLNVGVVARDPDWKPTQKLQLRLHRDANVGLDRAVHELFRRDGSIVDRQDLIALAIVRSFRTTSSRRPPVRATPGE